MKNLSTKKPWHKLTRCEKMACISLYPEEAKKEYSNDEDSSKKRISLAARCALGFTKEDLKSDIPCIATAAGLYFSLLGK